MSLIIQKFGGSSLGSVAKVHAVANIIIEACRQGHQIVVVVSAMQGETDRLLALSLAVGGDSLREQDVLMATGEQISASILSMVLMQQGADARSYTGAQVGILTTAQHQRAKIKDINTHHLMHDLSMGRIPVVTGFQGVTEDGDITTLGRGGSDITAVALAVALKADECQVYTDVDGIYTADPKVVPTACQIDRIPFDSMMELASLGAKVLQKRCLAFARKHRVPIRVLSTNGSHGGTLITFNEVSDDICAQDQSETSVRISNQSSILTHSSTAVESRLLEQALVMSITFERQAILTMQGIPQRPGLASYLLSPLSEADIAINMMIQNLAVSSDQSIDLSFSVDRKDYPCALSILDTLLQEMNALSVVSSDRVVKLSIIGQGLCMYPGVLSTFCGVLGREDIQIHCISTAETKISAIINESSANTAVNALHKAFGLSQPLSDES